MMENPLHQNLLGALATVVYVKAVIGSCDFLVSRKWLASKISRKIVHMAAGSWILFWPLFDTSHVTWKLNITVPAVYTVQLFVKGAILRDPNDAEVKTLTRHGDPSELLYGPIFFCLVMCYVGLYCFRQPLAILVMACLGFGDGMAPLIGYYLPFGYYPTFPFGPEDKKTISGSIGFFISSILGYFIFQHLLLLEEEEPSAELSDVLRVVALATITEGISGGYDNISVPLSVHVAIAYL